MTLTPLKERHRWTIFLCHPHRPQIANRKSTIAILRLACHARFDNLAYH
jgi:hypothetical protein